MSETETYWPNGSRFALCLTHDVDRVDKTWWQCAYYFYKKNDLYQLRSLLTKHWEKPYWNFEKIMEIEERHGVRSTFFFLNETRKAQRFKPSTYALGSGYYRLEEPRIAELMRKLDSQGWEIGLHGSYDSFKNKELLLSEKNLLERIIDKPIMGIRQHHLNLNIPQTWEFQKEIGFRYDSSFGSNEKVEFPEGKVKPFLPLGDGFLVIPLTIMDGPLFDTGRNADEAWEVCEKLIDQAEGQGGLLTVLWHNNRFNEKEYPGQTGTYERLIEECQKRRAWVATAGEICQWCLGH